MTKILVALLCVAAISGYAQSDKYMQAMKNNLSQFDSVKTTEQYRALAATFERIGDAEKTEWLPYYYSALALLTPAWTDTKIDKDAWQTVINKEQPEVIATNNDSGLTYGAGVGFFVRKDSNNAKSANGSFSLRALYLWGDEIGYVKRGSVVVDPTTGTVNFEKGYSKTSVFLIQLGIYIF